MKQVALIVSVALVAGLATVAITSEMESARWARTPVHAPTPAPKPTMTVTLRMGEDFVKQWTVDVPGRDAPSWEHFTIDPKILKTDEEGLIQCRLFISRD